jgi:hypothetical protein
MYAAAPPKTFEASFFAFNPTQVQYSSSSHGGAARERKTRRRVGILWMYVCVQFHIVESSNTNVDAGCSPSFKKPNRYYPVQYKILYLTSATQEPQIRLKCLFI